jgi:Xaa-Pro aminopeptidase
MQDNSLLILFAGDALPKRGDEFYPFSPKRNFYYLTGIDSPRVILTIHKKDSKTATETLYIERFDETQAKWTGAPLSAAEAKAISGIETFRIVDAFEPAIASFLFNGNADAVYMDLENRYFHLPPTEDVAFANQLKEKFPAIPLINAYAIFARLRMIKSDEEIRQIQKAIRITAEGVDLMIRSASPGMMEYEIEAYFDYTLKKHGVKEKAFATIAAAGKNATVLHYSENNARTADGDLILFDLGAQCGYYAADISRTFPVNGKFSDRQKLLYNIVLAGQQKVINAIKPGIPFSSLNEILIEHYAEALKKIGLIEKKEDVAHYYYHSVGHMLGLETHDIGRSKEGVLQKGMVFTVEPGLYIAEENIGIRIEDDVVVTENGCDVLSKEIIKTVEEIEERMAHIKGRTVRNIATHGL